MRPLFILFIDLGIGGVQRKIVDIVNYLADYSPKLPIYIFLRKKPKFNITSQIKNKKVSLIFYPLGSKPFTFLLFPFFIAWYVLKLKPIAILAFLDVFSVSAVMSKYLFFWRKIRVVLSEDHFASGVFPHFRYGRFRPLALKLFYPLADIIFTCSRANRRDLVKNFALPKEKVKVIYNWTRFMDRKIKGKKRKYDLLYVGRLDKVKNTIFLIKVVDQVKKEKKDISLYLVGEGSEQEKLQTYVKNKGLTKNVFFQKANVNVKDYFLQSKICVFSPLVRAEGFPLVMLEAMALKVPILSRDFAGLKEFVVNNKTGIIVKDKKAFIKKALWLLEHPDEQKRIAQNAYNYVKKTHSLKNIKVYLRALNI